MDLDATEDFHSLAVPSVASTSTGYGSFTFSENSDRYLTIRRHTVGPGDPVHEQVCFSANEISSLLILCIFATTFSNTFRLKVLETHYMAQTQQNSGNDHLLPQTNHLPLFGQQQNTSYFGCKDPHLLKPPAVLNAVGGFGRRASGMS